MTSALAGLLFGFDTVVISGAEQKIQALWELSSALHGLAMSAALWGTVLGSLVGGWPADRFGRRPTLISIGILYLISAIWSALAGDVYALMVARLIGGLGVGISTVAAPLYISEISPSRNRGKLAGMFQFNIVFGILLAFLSNAIIQRLVADDLAWRWMLGIEALPAVLYTVLCFFIPESPRWLITQKGELDRARGILAAGNPTSSQKEIDWLVKEIDRAAQWSVGHQSAASRHWRGFISWRLRVPLLLAFLVAFFNQLSGINAILYFAPRIFQQTGMEAAAALLQSIGIGITNLLFTFVGLWLIDRLGRRTLLYIGSFGYIASLGICSWTFFTYAPQFQVASRAIELKQTVAQLEQLDLSGADQVVKRDALQLELRNAQAALTDASGSADYPGEPIEFPADASISDVQKLAETALDSASRTSRSGGAVVMICIFAFIAAHAVGQGTVIWVLISEIFPNRHRAMGQALGSCTHWVFAALITLAFPKAVELFSASQIFAFFCLMMVMQLLWVWKMVPETKGVPLEEIESKLGIR